MPRGVRTGHKYREWKRLIFLHFGRVCHICGHGGAQDADHLIPLAVHLDDHTDYRTGRPAHGIRGCPTCKRKCNQIRGAKPLEDDYKPELPW